MKKFLLFSVVVCCLFLVGCGQKKYEDAMKEYATSFYNNYQKGQEGLTNPTISIKQLKQAIDLQLSGADYDLSKLDKCSENSYVELIIDDTTKDVKDVKYFLECD